MCLWVKCVWTLLPRCCVKVWCQNDAAPISGHKQAGTWTARAANEHTELEDLMPHANAWEGPNKQPLRMNPRSRPTEGQKPAATRQNRAHTNTYHDWSQKPLESSMLETRLRPGTRQTLKRAGNSLGSRMTAMAGSEIVRVFQNHHLLDVFLLFSLLVCNVSSRYGTRYETDMPIGMFPKFSEFISAIHLVKNQWKKSGEERLFPPLQLVRYLLQC